MCRIRAAASMTLRKSVVRLCPQVERLPRNEPAPSDLSRARSKPATNFSTVSRSSSSVIIALKPLAQKRGVQFESIKLVLEIVNDSERRPTHIFKRRGVQLLYGCGFHHVNTDDSCKTVRNRLD